MNNSTDRRKFLKNSLFAVAGCTAAALGYQNSGEIISLLLPTRKKYSPVIRTLPIMGTRVVVSIYDTLPLDRANHIIDSALGGFIKVNKLMSVFDHNSEISRINNVSGRKSIAVNNHVINVVNKAIEYGKLSRGRFDITINPVMKAFGFREGSKASGEFPDIDEFKCLVNFNNIDIDSINKKVGLKKTGMGIDLGGIAKGYAVDLAVKNLRESGIEKAVVSAGGDIFGIGSPDDEDGWPIGIQDPLVKNKIYTKIRIRNCAIATSGNYEKTRNSEYGEIGHIIDPLSYSYSDGDILSSTVTAPSASEADVMATTAFLTGTERGKTFLDNLPDTEYLMIKKSPGNEVDIKTSENFPGFTF